jgi:hypothetical protein
MNSSDFGPFLIGISREEVERKDISGPLETLKKLVATPETIREFKTRVDVSFSGYDHTREELFEIPEVRLFVYELNEKFPFWLYFLSRDFMGLQCLAYCFLLPYLTEEARLETHPKQLADLLEQCWGPALDKICTAAGETESEADALLESALVYFKSGPTKHFDKNADDEGELLGGEDDHDNTSSEDLFGMLIEDSGPFSVLSEALRTLLQRPNLPPDKIQQMAKLLLIIESLPRSTPHIQVDLDLGERHDNGERSSMGIRAGTDEIRLSCTDYIIIDPRIGGDSQTEVWYEASLGGCREETASFALQEWVERFVELAKDSRQEIQIYSDTFDDGEIKWSPGPSESLWEQLDTEYP